jgi:hypothetical protein
MADNIRNQIERRLMEYAAEKYRLQQRMAVVLEMERELRGLLAQQEELQSEPDGNTQQPLAVAHASNPTNGNGAGASEALAGMAIQRLLSGGSKTRDQLIHDLRQEKFEFSGKSAARVVHLTLVNLKRRGLANQTPAGLWRLNKGTA